MSDETKEPFQESNLDSAEYRERLMRKLNCLIAVLEVAHAKVKKSLSGPKPDVTRLRKIQTNLTSTLEVCRRARRALEQREALPEGLPENLSEMVREATAKAPKTNRRRPKALPLGSRFEMKNSEEHARFTMMGQISKAEIQACDFESLGRRLQS